MGFRMGKILKMGDSVGLRGVMDTGMDGMYVPFPAIA
jgi:hypothetical protein